MAEIEDAVIRTSRNDWIALLYQDSDDYGSSLLVGMDEMDLTEGELTIENMLARCVEVELLQGVRVTPVRDAVSASNIVLSCRGGIAALNC